MKAKTCEKVVFEHLFHSMQICSEYQSCFQEYSDNIYETLLKRHDAEAKKLSKSIFASYIKLPIIVVDKIFKEFDVDNDGFLTKNEFTIGMWTLYFGSFEKLKEMIFKIFNFSNDIIYRQDVEQILNYLNSSDSLLSSANIEAYVKELFGEKDIIAYELFSLYIESQNSNVFVLILLFLYKNQPFTEESLKYFKENTTKGVAVPKSRGSFKFSRHLEEMMRPSAEITRILKYHFKPYEHVRRKKSKTNIIVYEVIESELEEELIEDDNYIQEEEENEFDDEEEQAAGKRKSSLMKISDKPLILYNSTLKHPVKKDRLIPRHSNKSLNSESHFPNTRYSSSMIKPGMKLSDSSLSGASFSHCVNDLNLNSLSIEEHNESYSNDFLAHTPHFESEIYKLTNENKFIKHKMVIVDKDLFLFRFSVTKDCYVLLCIYSLSGMFVTECQETTLLDKVFFPIAPLTSNGNTMAHMSNIFFFRKKEEACNLVEYLKKILNMRDIKNDYDLKQSVGKGQFGKVKLAVNKRTSEKVAVKVIEKKRLKGEELEVIKSEIDVMKFLKTNYDPNIVRPIDFYEDKDRIYMVMEYLGGGTLNKYLHSKKEVMNETLSKLLCKQITNGLNFLHKFGIIHRDIKPDNIMLLNSVDSSPTLKITDFGLSKVLSKNQKAKEGFGTLVYTSPEILMRNVYNSKVDVWSLGILIYYINSGLLPFDGENLTLQQIAEKICHDEVSFKNKCLGFSSELMALIRACLVKSPTMRVDIRSVLKSEWFNL